MIYAVIVREWTSGPKIGERGRLLWPSAHSSDRTALLMARELFPIGNEYPSKVTGWTYRVVAHDVETMETKRW